MTDTVAADQLRSIIERVERLAEDRKAIADDISEVFKEARSSGFDTKVIKKLIADRAKGSAAVAEFEAVYELYRDALEGPRMHAHTREAA